MRIREWLSILGATILIAGCSTRPVTEKRALTSDEVFKLVEERNASVKTLHGRGNISIDSPERSMMGAFTLSMRYSDSLLLDVRGPFGIHVGSLSLTKQSFLFYNSLENTVMEGEPDSSTLFSILKVGMNVDKVFEAFSGSYPVLNDSLLRFSSTEDEYLAAFSHNGTTVEYRIDAETYIVTDLLVKDGSDKVLFKAESSQLTSENSIPIPSTLIVSFPDEARKVTLVYKELSLNENVQCSFRAPKNAEVIQR